MQSTNSEYGLPKVTSLSLMLCCIQYMLHNIYSICRQTVRQRLYFWFPGSLNMLYTAGMYCIKYLEPEKKIYIIFKYNYYIILCNL